MRRFTLIPLFAVAVGCTETSPTEPSRALTGGVAVSAMEVNEKQPVDLPLIACNGETVPMTGEVHVKLKFTTATSGNVSAFFSADYHLSGIGLVTGARYHGTLHIRDQEMASDNVSNFHHRTSLKLVGQGSVPNSDIGFTVHVVTANGETRVEHTDVTTRCMP